MKVVQLPHDAMIEEKRNPENASGSAGSFFPGGIYIYKKNFFVAEDWNDKKILIEFEGVYKDACIYINGKETGKNAYGYTQFLIDTEGFLQYGKTNEIKVVVDNSQHPNSRWYTGSGIHRPVWMHIGNKEHIRHPGLRITTLSHQPARIQIETQHTGEEVQVEIRHEGTTVASGKGDNLSLDIPSAKLWSDESPHLYQCVVQLKKDGKIVDQVVEDFGIRTIEWNANGLFVNGNETLLRGGCVHSDNGILGAVSLAVSEDRRIRIMKEAGFNAIRSSHNPASKAMLEACDKYGMYVMDESWDMWYFHKSKYDYASQFMDHYKHDLRAMVERDYNHPSVIMYSIGNEISEPKDEKGVQLAREMVAIIKELDATRPVTCGVNLMVINMASKGKGIYKEEGGREKETTGGGDKKVSSTLFNLMTSFVGTGMNKAANSKKADAVTTPLFDSLDIAGYNYASGRYRKEGKIHPERILVGSETFPQDIAKNWKMVKELPYLIGDFMWTAWDYLGEAGIGAWSYTEDGRRFDKPYPWLLADVGAIDILGNIGAEAEYAAIVWGVRKEPYIAVQPVNQPGNRPAKSVWRGTNGINSWSWRNCEGNKAIVEVYADAHSAKIIVGEKESPKKKLKDYKATFKTNYRPGKLTLITYDEKGNEINRTALASATGKTGLRLTSDFDSVFENEIVYVDVALVGENGMVESNDDQPLTITVDGGELLAFGSANPRTEEEYHQGKFTSYYGRAQAVVRSKHPGDMKVTVKGENVIASAIKIQVKERVQ
ncbi:MAG: glycoside hydrolase family 2 TIM barrel-domain containing protein [Trichococcus sp.]|uniref:glycoside hydrolase family 2 TIM barrel-domain containing protein n=1 Tax=Trichococcus sp. TaxID=1985464 RepID=UPI003C68A087